MCQPVECAEVTLKLRFAGRCLYVRRFAGSVWSPHCAAIPPEELPALCCGPSEQARLLRSFPVTGNIPKLRIAGNVIRYTAAQYRHYYIRLEGDFARYLNGLSASRRSELRRKVRWFRTSGGPGEVFREYRHPSEMPAFHELAREVSLRSFQHRLGAGIPATPDFVQHLTEQARAGLIRGFILFYRNRPVAYEVCRVNGDCLTGEQCGYDPEFGKMSPGMVLFYCALERAFAEGVRTFDFGPGEAPYKATFATGSTPSADIYCLPLTGGNVCLVLAHWALSACSSLLGDILELLHVKGRVRRLLRRGAAHKGAGEIMAGPAHTS